MRTALRSLLIVGVLAAAGAAFAYSIKDVKSDRKDVYCDDGTFVGSMFWNGSNWSDGQRWDSNPDVVAKKMVAAQGGSCQ